MAVVAVQSAIITGLNPSYSSADVAGDTVANDGKTFLHVKNGDASAHTVTVASTVTSPGPGEAAADAVVSVPAGGERIIGPFPRAGFNDSSGNLAVTYDAVTSVTLAAIKVA